MTYDEKLSLLPHGFSFLVIGAADGKTLDPMLYKLIKLRKATGVFVEPLHDLFEMLKENYKECSGIEFIDAAVDFYFGSRAMKRVPLELCSPSWRMGVGSFYSNRNALSDKEISPLVVQEEVTTIPLRLVAHNPPYDLIQIDTEGHDWVVFQQWEWAWGKPRIICIEDQRVPPSERNFIHRKLKDAGYSWFQDGDNIVATI